MTEDSEQGVAEDQAKRHNRRRFVTIAGAAAAAGAAGAAANVVGAEPVGSVHGINNLIAASTAGLPTTVDGFTSSAIQAVINSLPATGGTVWLPDGTYSITTTVTIDKPVHLRSATAVLQCDATTHVLGVESDGVTLEGLTIDGRYTTHGPGWAVLVMVNSVDDLHIRGCRFFDGRSSAINLANVSNVTIEGCVIEHMWESGIRVSDPGAGENRYLWFLNNRFDECNLLEDAGHGSIHFHGGEFIQHSNATIQGNHVLRSGTGGIALEGNDSFVTDNFVDNRNDAYPVNHRFGECISATGSRITIANNTCINGNTTSAGCILLWIDENRNPVGVRIIGNDCSNGGQGIAVAFGWSATSVTDLLISANICHDNSYGIQSYVHKGVTGCTQSYVSVTGNLVANNRSDTIQMYQGGALSGNATLFGNKTDDGYLVNGSSFTWTSMQALVGANGSSSTITPLNLIHQDSTAVGGSTLRMEGRFGARVGVNAGGLGVRRVDATTDVETFMYGYNAGAIVEGPKMTSDGSLSIPDGTWDGRHLIMGAYHFWVDGSGHFRKKLGAPASDTDGTIV